MELQTQPLPVISPHQLLQELQYQHISPLNSGERLILPGNIRLTHHRYTKNRRRPAP